MIRVTDIHNAAAILRTASFYGVDALIIPRQSSLEDLQVFIGLPLGQGSTLPTIEVASTAKFIGKLNSLNVATVALSEHVDQSLNNSDFKSDSLCLVVGKEDVGISNAVQRQAQFKLSLMSQGAIKSLNVSTAAAIAMENASILIKKLANIKSNDYNLALHHNW